MCENISVRKKLTKELKMKGTKKFYNKMVESIREDERRIANLNETKKDALHTKMYDEQISFLQGRINATKEIIYKLFPDCTLSADLKQGN